MLLVKAVDKETHIKQQKQENGKNNQEPLKRFRIPIYKSVLINDLNRSDSLIQSINVVLNN